MRNSGKWIAMVMAMGLVFMACKPEAEENMEDVSAFKAAMCANPPFPGGEAVGPESNDPVLCEYGGACDSVVKLSGLRFRGAQDAYLCRSKMVYEAAPDVQAPDQVKVKERFGDMMEQADLLMTRRMMFTEFGVVVLVNDLGNPVKALANQAMIEADLERVENAEGAAALAYLMGQLGEGYAPQALCNAEVVADDNGWTFRKADVWYNCQARQWRDVSVSKIGEVNLLKTEDQKDEKGNSFALCVD